MGTNLPRNILLLQGPMSTFFAKLAAALEAGGSCVHKINFNGGDCLFYWKKRTLLYTQTTARWESFLSDCIDRFGIDAVLVYGDCRYYHRIARSVAKKKGVDFRVFEEGYIRPDYITFERYGVNGWSHLPRDRSAYFDSLGSCDSKEPAIGDTFVYRVVFAILYHLAGFFSWWRFRHYKHHRSFSATKEGALWIRAGLRRVVYAIRERRLSRRVRGDLSRKYFLAVLQVFDDSQIKFHSDYKNVSEFIEEVVASFSRYAGPDTCLVIKHHPLDRGHTNYRKIIARLARLYGLGQRMIYVHDLHLPTLLQNALGVVTINSTVGLSALYHGTPVKVMGRAVYDIDGLICSADLCDFWSAPGDVNRDLFHQLRGYLVAHVQIHGSYYKAPEETARAACSSWLARTEVSEQPAITPAKGSPLVPEREVSSRELVAQTVW